MSLIMDIMETIATPVSQLAAWLEETYNIEVDETISKWQELTGMNIAVKNGEVSHDKVKSLNVNSTKITKKIPKTKDVCQHIFLSGKKAGEQCSTKPKNGATFCSAHKPKDSVKSVKSTKAPKTILNDKINSDFESDSEDEHPPQKNKKKVLNKPKTSSKASSSDASEPETPVKPLLKKNKSPCKPAQQYDTDDEIIDNDETISDSD